MIHLSLNRLLFFLAIASLSLNESYRTRYSAGAMSSPIDMSSWRVLSAHHSHHSNCRLLCNRQETSRYSHNFQRESSHIDTRVSAWVSSSNCQFLSTLISSAATMKFIMFAFTIVFVAYDFNLALGQIENVHHFDIQPLEHSGELSLVSLFPSICSEMVQNKSMDMWIQGVELKGDTSDAFTGERF